MKCVSNSNRKTTWDSILDKQLSEDEIQQIAEQARATHVDDATSWDPLEVAVESRRVWDNPVLWREICTWAYGRKIVIVRLVYLQWFS